MGIRAPSKGELRKQFVRFTGLQVRPLLLELGMLLKDLWPHRGQKEQEHRWKIYPKLLSGPPLMPLLSIIQILSSQDLSFARKVLQAVVPS